MKQGRLALLALVFALTLSGCGTKPQKLDQTFWQEPAKQKVAIAINTLPKGGALYKEGGQGLLDMAISSIATADLSHHLESLRPDAFLQIRALMAERLAAQGFEVVQFEQALDLDKLPKRGGEGEFERDLGSIASATQADRILIYRVDQFGAARAYYGFIPMSAPQGFIAAYGALVDAKTNKLMWHTGSTVADSFIKEPVVGEWDEPPAYPNLTAAVDRAVEKAKRVLVDKFFSK